ncbi:MAG TPA: CoA transferase [Rhodospirillales bacterium]|jgi:crotonobetainyl-CoA:carnitine CoA-transferase CaiB-like acyl-CoA transferase|nr:MAG: Acetyl-CoA:oxalate CoA-transferase [Alphaproteobacteria bacterium MarineAlpha3_Bin2]HIM24196.1 CoA transferase [Rhodospirillales bacterium]HIM77616.1 CoA transferase [Rhodospirillales bacterium]
MAGNGGPLTGLKVIELAHIMAGPACGLMLADMGADVIKVEKVPGGDDSRRFLPPDIDGESAAFMMMNRNKRGIAVNLKEPGGKKVIKRLFKTADVVIENYRIDTMDKLGLGYDDLIKENPGLIYCAISGFGRTGPYAERGGFDLIAQGMSGLMSITGEGPGRPPVKMGAPITDITAGILGAMAVSAAYAHKLKTGEGQKIDTSLFEAGIVHTYWQSAIGLATGVAPGPMGSAHPLNGPYQAFQTTDGWITLGAANQKNWLRMLDVLDAPEIADDPRFAENSDRMTFLKELEDLLGAIFAKHSTEDWLARLDAAGVPAGPVLNVNEMHKDPQTVARDMVVEVDHAQVGPVKTLGIPVKFSETPGQVTSSAPVYGQHTREVLSEYGFDEGEIDTLVSAGAVVAD